MNNRRIHNAEETGIMQMSRWVQRRQTGPNIGLYPPGSTPPDFLNALESNIYVMNAVKYDVSFLAKSLEKSVWIFELNRKALNERNKLSMKELLGSWGRLEE